MTKRELDALSLIRSSGRFDLIFKYEFAREILGLRPGNSAAAAYVSHIRAFNNFYEEEPRKTKIEDFIESFRSITTSIQRHGYLATSTPIPINESLDPLDGAHRIGAAAALGLPVLVEDCPGDAPYNWKFFESRGLSTQYLDFGAKHRSRLDTNTRVFLVFPRAPASFDIVLDRMIAEEGGRVLYRKKLDLKMRGLTALKTLLYETWPEQSWIGSAFDRYRGAKKHAIASAGAGPLRVLLLGGVGDSQVSKIKAQFRENVGAGNFSCHAEDNHADSSMVAEFLFHPNVGALLNNMPLGGQVEHIVSALRNVELAGNLSEGDRNKILVAGSSTMQLYGIRASRDIDVIWGDDMKVEPVSDGVVNVRAAEDRDLLPADLQSVLVDDSLSFSLKGWHHISLLGLSAFKRKRGEWPKDHLDIFLISVHRAVPRFKHALGPLVTWATEPRRTRKIKRSLREFVDRLYLRSRRVWQSSPLR